MKNVKLFDSPIKVLGGSILLIEGILAAILASGKTTETQNTWIIIGMIVTLLTTIIGAIIIHWINNRKVTSSVTLDTSDKVFEYDVFISFPIAAVKSKTERLAINEFANKLEEKLKEIGYKKIFNASVHFSNKHEHQPPKIAAKI